MDLRSNEIHLYFTFPKQVTDPELLHRYEALLSDDERQQMPRFYFDRHRHQHLLTRALIRTVLSRYYDVEPDEWIFANGAYGKPDVASPEIQPPIHFNISHADGLIICGLTRDFNIGVDVEDCQRSTQTAFKRLSSYFSTREIRDLDSLPESLQKQRFFDYWTLKEAYIKARGAGLSIPLSSFSFQFKQDKLTGFNIDKGMNGHPEDWQFWRISMPENHRIAVAVNSGDTRFSLSAAKLVPLEGQETIELNFL